MSEHVYLLTIGLPLMTVLAVFAMKYLASVAQARARQEQLERYQELAAGAAAAQAQVLALLTSIQGTIGNLDGRLARVEAVLKEVE